MTTMMSISVSLELFTWHLSEIPDPKNSSHIKLWMNSIFRVIAIYIINHKFCEITPDKEFLRIFQHVADHWHFNVWKFYYYYLLVGSFAHVMIQLLLIDCIIFGPQDAEWELLIPTSNTIPYTFCCNKRSVFHHKKEFGLSTKLLLE